MSRRQFVIGLGAVVAAGGTGAGLLVVSEQAPSERGVHHAGTTSSPDRSVAASGATQVSGAFRSRYMRGESLGWTLSSPAGTGALDGVIFCLHGYHQDHRFAFDGVGLPDAAGAAGLRVAVAAVDGGADSYWHKRADGTDALSMLLYEFVPMIEARTGPVPRALMGWSMGGYGALLAAERDPGGFVAVAPASPALWLTPGETAPGAFDGPGDFYANDVFTGVARLAGLTIAVACGTGDPFYAAARHLVAELPVPHSVFFGPGFHDASYWRRVAPEQLRAIGPSLTRGSRS